MSIHCRLTLLMIVLVIENISDAYVSSGRQTQNEFRNRRKATNYQTNDQTSDANRNRSQSSAEEEFEYPSAAVLEGAASLVSKSVRQTVTLVKCVLKCFMQRFTLNLCYQIFPCLYDCFIGQEYIPPDIEQQINEIDSHRGLVFPSAFSMKSIFTMIKCLYECATERQIRDWETFAYSLYCFADSCVCYKVFNTNG